MSRLRAALPLLLLIATGALLVASGALDAFRPERLATSQAELHASVAAHPALATLVYIGVLALSIATGIPGSLFVILAGGLLFGVVIATMLTGVGLTLGSLLLFLASRFAFSSGRAPPALAERLRAGFHANPLSYTLFLRLVPVFPFGGVTVALAWLRCPLWLFLGATAFGGSLMAVFETSIGAGLGDTLAQGHPPDLGLLLAPRVLLPLLALGALALLPVLWRRRRDSRPSA